jgi:hypothetical protein
LKDKFQLSFAGGDSGLYEFWISDPVAGAAECAFVQPLDLIGPDQSRDNVVNLKVAEMQGRMTAMKCDLHLVDGKRAVPGEDDSPDHAGGSTHPNKLLEGWNAPAIGI